MWWCGLCPLPASGGPVLRFLSGGGRGMFYGPWEKTVMFLNAPYGRNPAVPSGVSDERRRLKASAEEFCRVGRIPAMRDI